ncbi:MAG: serine/threonine protein kinase [Mycobacteriaceae bacterium]|nr:serine/threonine protein kinase [Mycobacteriaceae bacterium]
MSAADRGAAADQPPEDTPSTTPDSSTSSTPTHIADYRVERVLANGGMGAVYLVQSPTLPRREALKLLRADLAHDTHIRTRFLREADITADLEHPNIVRLFNRGETDTGQLWITMEYIQGTNAEMALHDGTMTPARALHIITEVARALDCAHSRGVVHQDIKPSNFLLGHTQPGGPERVVLSDFGAALTSENTDPAADGPMTATLAYSAPEVITGEPLDGRADVYSLGCTLFRLLSGVHPYNAARGVPATVKAHLDVDPPRLSDRLSWASPQLDTVITKALAKRPADRYRTAGDFAAAAVDAVKLERGGSSPIQARTSLTRRVEPSPPTKHAERDDNGTAADFINLLPHTRPVGSQRRRLVVASVLAAAIALVAAVWFVGSSSKSPPSMKPTTTPTELSAPPDEALNRLRGMLPAGYTAGTCKPQSPAGTAGVITCGRNSDPGGPGTATYTLTSSPAALRDALNRVIQTTTVVICPGNIQSPGPWRRNDSLTVTRGTVLCGLHNGRPRVVWTNDAEHLLADVQSRSPTDPPIGQLYAWWGSHS